MQPFVQARPLILLAPIGVFFVATSWLPLYTNRHQLQSDDLVAGLAAFVAGAILVFGSRYRRTVVPTLTGNILLTSYLPWPGKTVSIEVECQGQPVAVNSQDVGRDDVSYRHYVWIGSMEVWCFDDTASAQALHRRLIAYGCVMPPGQ